MRRMHRLGALGIGVLGLLATPAPFVRAETNGMAAFVAQVHLGGPLGSPVNPTTPGLPTIDATTVPGNVTSEDCGGHGPLRLTSLLHPLESLIQRFPKFRQCHPHYGGHTRAIVGATSSMCTEVGANTNKSPKSPLQSGLCNFALAGGRAPEGNHVHGFCGLSAGEIQLQFSNSVGQTFLVDIAFEAYGTTLFLLGHAAKLSTTPGHTSLLWGTAQAVPVPSATGGNSCGSSTATAFTVVGSVTLTYHPFA